MQLEHRDAGDEPEVAGDRGHEHRLLQDELRTDHGVAPSALRMPISFVRSFTAIIMMFETPTTPASNVPMPITHTKMRMPPMRFTKRWNSTTAFEIEHRALRPRGRSRVARRCGPAGPSTIASLSATVASPIVSMIMRDAVGAVEGALRGRDREVDHLELALAALVGEHADDRKGMPLTSMYSPIGGLALEELLLHAVADHRHLAELVQMSSWLMKRPSVTSVFSRYRWSGCTERTLKLDVWLL